MSRASTDAVTCQRLCAAIVLALACAACDRTVPFTDAAPQDVPPDMGATAPGAPCGVGEQGEPLGGCSGGQYCLTSADGFPNGYCAPDCLRARCPEGSTCFPVGGTRRYCVRTCRTDADCRVREGYACREPTPGAPPACLPDDEPVGRREDGGACYTRALADGGVPGGGGAGARYLAPLPRARFAASGDGLAVSRMRIGTRAEAEATVALAGGASPAAVVAFDGLDARDYFRGGLARVAPDGASVLGALAVTDRDFPDVLQPSVAVDRAGRVHLVYLGNNLDRPGNAVRYARSDDGGATFGATTRNALPFDLCNAQCLSPALALGPALADAGATDDVYVAALPGQTNRTRRLMLARAPAAGEGEFGAPVEVARTEMTTETVRDPNAIAVGAGPAPGAVYVAWVAIRRENQLATLGDRANRVRLRVSRDGGATFTPEVTVSREGTDAPVSQSPWVAAGGAFVHGVYVTGGLTGAWDVVLATSADGGATFVHRQVNDDPDRCATHAFVGLAVEPASGDAHLVWLDNRFGAGLVAYARCPADPRERCGRNEAVSEAPFVFTTALDPLRWHGTHSSLALGPDDSLWAAWSDTRTGGPAVYAARGTRR